MASNESRIREAKKQIGIVLEEQENKDEQLEEIHNRLGEFLPNNQ